MTRRWTVMVSIGAVLVLLASVGIGVGVWLASASSVSASVIGPHDPEVVRAEAARKVEGSQVRSYTLTAAPVTVSVGGRSVQTWAFNGQVPGPEIRADAGDTVRVAVINDLPKPLTVHWHGIAIRNDMDGVPGQTQDPIKPGQQFTYEFTVPDAGTYFYHSHEGVQLDRGLYGPLVVAEKGAEAQRDVTLLLDDWLDGTGTTPEATLAKLKANGGAMGGSGGSGMGGMNHGGGMDMGEMDHSGMSGMGGANANSPLGSDTADVKYPMYLINGKSSTDPAAFSVSPGEQVRVRLINAGASTPFRVASGAGQMTVVGTDGYPVDPVEADSLVIGMGERYDVLVTAPQSGSMPIVAQVEGDTQRVVSQLRVSGDTPPTDSAPAGLAMTPLQLSDLHASAAVALASKPADVTYDVTMTGGMMGFDWGLNAPSPGGVSLPVREGQRVRLNFVNNTMMWHPIHLHGHTFQVDTGSGVDPRKDTVAVAPMSTVSVEFDADNPGTWMLHCHNIYHAETGMMTDLTYIR